MSEPWTYALIGGPLHGVKRKGRLAVAIVDRIWHGDACGGREHTYKLVRCSLAKRTITCLYAGWRRVL